jgi:hypothetical protein
LLKPITQMTKIEELFIESLADLRDRISEPSRYDNLKASAILRQLLADVNPLLHLVNREYNHKTRFITRQLQHIEPLKVIDGQVQSGMIINIESIVPLENEPEENLEQLTIDLFLGKRCLIYCQYRYNVIDIIKINANMQGGVHAGAPRQDNEHAAIELANLRILIGFNNGTEVDIITGLIHPVAQIVIKALEPIENLINNKYNT